MLSNPLQRFSPYHSIPSNAILSNGHHVSGNHLHAGLETFGHGPQYALQHLQQHVGIHAPHLTRAPQQKHRQHPYGGPGTRATGSSGPIRRRISRACDQCNQLRTKCDGQHPCAHCIGRVLLLFRILDVTSAADSQQNSDLGASIFANGKSVERRRGKISLNKQRHKLLRLQVRAAKSRPNTMTKMGQSPKAEQTTLFPQSRISKTKYPLKLWPILTTIPWIVVRGREVSTA